jgi:hypothetical protein
MFAKGFGSMEETVQRWDSMRARLIPQQANQSEAVRADDRKVSHSAPAFLYIHVFTASKALEGKVKIQIW